MARVKALKLGQRTSLACGWPVQIEGPFPWCAQAERGLAGTYYDNKQGVIDGVQNGSRELWRVDGDGWLVTQILPPDMLFVWCYQGRNFVNLFYHLRIAARKAGLSKVSFFTHHRAALRALRRWHPAAFPTPIQGEAQYFIEAAP